MTIDWWTLGIQTVNVAILVWLLQRFFWQPVAAVIVQRRAATQQTMAEADAAKAQAAAALAEIERTRAGFADEREAILTAAHADAETTRAEVLAEARQQAAAIATATQAAIEQEQQAAAGVWQERSARLAIAIAGQLAARLDGTAVRAAFLDWLLRELAAHRQVLSPQAATFEVVSATALDAAEQTRTRERLTEALGSDATIVFAVDPALIAGLELHGPHLLVRNSWRADLEQIMAGLIERPAQAAAEPHSEPATLAQGPER